MIENGDRSVTRWIISKIAISMRFEVEKENTIGPTLKFPDSECVELGIKMIQGCDKLSNCAPGLESES